MSPQRFASTHQIVVRFPAVAMAEPHRRAYLEGHTEYGRRSFEFASPSTNAAVFNFGSTWPRNESQGSTPPPLPTQPPTAKTNVTDLLAISFEASQKQSGHSANPYYEPTPEVETGEPAADTTEPEATESNNDSEPALPDILGQSPQLIFRQRHQSSFQPRHAYWHQSRHPTKPQPSRRGPPKNRIPNRLFEDTGFEGDDSSLDQAFHDKKRRRTHSLHDREELATPAWMSSVGLNDDASDTPAHFETPPERQAQPQPHKPPLPRRQGCRYDSKQEAKSYNILRQCSAIEWSDGNGPHRMPNTNQQHARQATPAMIYCDDQSRWRCGTPCSYRPFCGAQSLCGCIIDQQTMKHRGGHTCSRCHERHKAGKGAGKPGEP